MSDFMKLDEAIEIVLELATDNVLGDDILANDPHLSDEQARQESAIATVEECYARVFLLIMHLKEIEDE